MPTAATRPHEDNSTERRLYLAFELGESKWKLGFTTAPGQPIRERTIRARDQAAVRHEIAQAKRRFGLAQGTRVRSCYEAGREGFWLARWLEAEGITNLVVDSSSIEVNRRARRAKSDRLDVRKLVAMMLRYAAGERRVWSVVRMPSVEAEDARQLHRELQTAKRDRTRVTNRIKGLLATQGVRCGCGATFLTQLERVRLWNGAPLPGGLRARLEREWSKVELLQEHIRVLEAKRRQLLRTSEAPAIDVARQLQRLRGIGVTGGWVYAMELFGWRRFHNRRQVGGLVGLTPTPFASGAVRREQGIAKAGNRHVRALAIELAWGWLRFQPGSALTLWYATRFGHGSSRLRRIGIVALARKLLIALWRFVETGVVPEGAALKV